MIISHLTYNLNNNIITITIAAMKITIFDFTLPGENRFCERENEKV